MMFKVEKTRVIITDERNPENLRLYHPPRSSAHHNQDFDFKASYERSENWLSMGTPYCFAKLSNSLHNLRFFLNSVNCPNFSALQISLRLPSLTSSNQRFYIETDHYFDISCLSILVSLSMVFSLLFTTHFTIFRRNFSLPFKMYI